MEVIKKIDPVHFYPKGLILTILIFATMAFGVSANTLTQRFTKAQKLAKEKRWKEAISLLEPMADELPESVLLKLSDYYREIKDFHSEIRHLDSLIAKKPQRMIYHFRRGRAYSRLRSKRKSQQKSFDKEAVVSLRKAVHLQPTFKAAYTLLFEVFNRTNNFVEARATVLDMVPQFGRHPKYLTKLCRLYIIDEYIDEGIQVCQEAVDKDLKEPMNYVFLAQGHANKGDHAQAQSTLTRATKRFPNSAYIQEINGKHHLSKGGFSTAEKYFQKAIDREPKRPDSHVGLAISHFERQNYDTALSSYLRACQLSRSKVKEYRLAITKLRGANHLKIAEKYESQLHKCSTKP